MNIRFENQGVRYRLSPDEAGRLAAGETLCCHVDVARSDDPLTLTLALSPDRVGMTCVVADGQVRADVDRAVVEALLTEGEWRGRCRGTLYLVEIDRHAREPDGRGGGA
ncbi:MAG: hypothetical protein KDA21_12345 [Phycisphaerales bacterium]|nr:hypothetical protein [Phycisphaerales bacterium]